MRLDHSITYKHAVKRNTKGFTLIEVMFSLSVLVVIASLMPILFLSLHGANERLEESVAAEWDLFLMQFRKEVEKHDIEKIDQQKLTLKSKEGDTILFSSYGSLLRRQVNGMGHEVYLTSIQSISFSLQGTLLQLEVLFQNGTTKKAQIIDAAVITDREHYAASSLVFYGCTRYGCCTPNHEYGPNQALRNDRTVL